MVYTNENQWRRGTTKIISSINSNNEIKLGTFLYRSIPRNTWGVFFIYFIEDLILFMRDVYSFKI